MHQNEHSKKLAQLSGMAGHTTSSQLPPPPRRPPPPYSGSCCYPSSFVGRRELPPAPTNLSLPSLPRSSPSPACPASKPFQTDQFSSLLLFHVSRSKGGRRRREGSSTVGPVWIEREGEGEGGREERAPSSFGPPEIHLLAPPHSHHAACPVP